MTERISDKILSRAEAVSFAEAARRDGKVVGFTSGTFDLLHPGHVTYLESARQLVDVLIVGVNSDSSVRQYKDPSRPIVSESARLRVVAALSSVDRTFLFSELNNNENIRLLRPDKYIKAGDYTAQSLSSKPIVESYGGSVELVPMEDGYSTTNIIHMIETSLRSVEGEEIVYQQQPAIFVDRDGTICEHVEYLSEPSKFKEIPGSFAALKKLREAGFRIVVITNQPGIGLGYFSKEDLFAVNREMMKQATAAGLSIDRIYFCPHSKADQCKCRKPGTYLIDRCVKELQVDLTNSFMIGDMTSDVELAKNARCTGVLVTTGRGGQDGICAVSPDIIATDLSQAADEILKRVSNREGK